MPLTRPAPGAPFDKRLTDTVLAGLLATPLRAFNPATDSDLFDAIEAFITERVTAAVIPGGVQLGGLNYLTGAYTTDQPGVNAWGLGSTPIPDTRPYVNVAITRSATEVTPAYRYGAPDTHTLPAVNGVAALAFTLPLAVPVDGVTVRFSAPSRLYVNAAGTGYTQADATDTTYDLVLRGPAGTVITQRLAVPVIAQATRRVTRTATLTLAGAPAQRTVLSEVEIDLPVGVTLAAGTYTLSVTLRALSPLTDTTAYAGPAAGPAGGLQDFNAYPVTDAGYPGAYFAAGPYPDGQPAAGALVVSFRPAPAAATLTTYPDRVEATGAQLIRRAGPVGPSGGLLTRAVIEFTVADTPALRAWGGVLAVMLTAGTDAVTAEELGAGNTGLIGATYGALNTNTYGAFPPADLNYSLRGIAHRAQDDRPNLSFGLLAGVRCRVELWQHLVTQGAAQVPALRSRWYTQAGELLAELDDGVVNATPRGTVPAYRAALILPPNRGLPQPGPPLTLTIHRWAEWRE